MADGSADRTCVIAVLVARSGSAQTLVVAGEPGEPVMLPSVEVAVEPSTEDVVMAAGRLLGQPVVLLRSNALGWLPDTYDTTELVAEVETPSDDAPPGFRWQALADEERLSVEPAWAAPSCASWLDERDLGWSELRAPWSRPGWFASASAWMGERLDETGYAGHGPPRVHHLWSISAVLVAESGAGRAYLKCSTGTFKHEAVLTQGLAERSAGGVPDVLAVEPDQGWLLMKELPAPELGEQPEADWAAGLVVLAGLQHEWLGRAEELLSLGAQPRPFADLVAWVEASPTSEDLMGRLDPTVRQAWLSALPDLVEACHRLEVLGPGPTLVHGDFHPWNVAGSGAETRVFDWTDGALAHPFVDLASYVMRAKDEDVREHLLAAYLDCWRDELAAEDLAEAAQLALVVGSLYQAQTYTRLVPTVMPADRAQLADGDVEWMRRTLDRMTMGVRGAY